MVNATFGLLTNVLLHKTTTPPRMGSKQRLLDIMYHPDVATKTNP